MAIKGEEERERVKAMGEREGGFLERQQNDTAGRVPRDLRSIPHLSSRDEADGQAHGQPRCSSPRVVCGICGIYLMPEASSEGQAGEAKCRGHGTSQT